MKPLPLSATKAPSSSFQLAVPIGLQLSRFLPSNNVIQPASACAAASRDAGTDNRPILQINNDAAMIAQRFMVFPPVTDCFVVRFIQQADAGLFRSILALSGSRVPPCQRRCDRARQCRAAARRR